MRRAICDDMSEQSEPNEGSKVLCLAATMEKFLLLIVPEKSSKLTSCNSEILPAYNFQV